MWDRVGWSRLAPAVAVAALVVGVACGPTSSSDPDVSATDRAEVTATQATPTAAPDPEIAEARDVPADPAADAEAATAEREAAGSRQSFPLSFFGAFEVEFQVAVIQVLGADRFEVMYPDGSTLVVGLLGADVVGAPSANGDGGGASGSCMGGLAGQAVEFASSAALGRVAGIVLDPASTAPTWSDGPLVYVKVDGHDLGAALIEEGLATTSSLDEFGRRDVYLQLEEQAKARSAGLWNC